MMFATLLCGSILLNCFLVLVWIAKENDISGLYREIEALKLDRDTHRQYRAIYKGLLAAKEDDHAKAD